MELSKYLKNKIQTLNNHENTQSRFSQIKKSYFETFKFFSLLAFKKPKNSIIVVLFLLYFYTLIGAASFFANLEFSAFGVFVGTIKLAIFYCLAIATLSAVMTLGFIVETGYKHLTIKKYREKGPIYFKEEQYQKAAETLKKFKKIKLKEAVEKYGREIVDILIMTDCIYFASYRTLFSHKTYLQRAVSIKAIEEDREAYDDEE